jgi:hypothetical protein
VHPFEVKPVPVRSANVWVARDECLGPATWSGWWGRRGRWRRQRRRRARRARDDPVYVGVRCTRAAGVPWPAFPGAAAEAEDEQRRRRGRVGVALAVVEPDAAPAGGAPAGSVVGAGAGCAAAEGGCIRRLCQRRPRHRDKQEDERARHHVARRIYAAQHHCLCWSGRLAQARPSGRPAYQSKDTRLVHTRNYTSSP